MDEKGQGWMFFAAIVLGIAGIMRIFDAIQQAANDSALEPQT